MPDAVAVPEGQPLTQVERFVDAFVAPSKTFSDILRSASCWVPILVLVILSTAFAYTVDKKVGFEAVAQQQLEKMPSMQERIDAMAPADRAKVYQQRAVGTRISTYGFPVLALIIIAIETLLLWASFNFGLGAKTTFGQVFAVVLYAGLPKILIWILAIVLLFAGVGIDGFDLQNPAGTNIGYFLSNNTLRAAGGFFDIFGLWALALLVLGMAIISRKSKGAAAAIVVGWWVIGLLISTGIAAAFS